MITFLSRKKVNMIFAHYPMNKIKSSLFTIVLIIFLLPLHSQGPRSDSSAVWLAQLKAGKTIQWQSPGIIDSIIDFAMTKKGCAYKAAGTGPNSFDCSGFVYYVHQHFGIALTRSSRDQYLLGKKVRREDIQRGDLVFFTRGKRVGHVGLVISVDSTHNFTFIHSSTYGTGVRIDKYSQEGYRRTFVGARRMIECKSPLLENVTNDSTDTKPMISSQETSQKDSVVTVVIPQPKPQPAFFYHKVKKGQTLSHIAVKYHVSVAKIKKWNHLRSDFIREGQKLKIYRK